MVRLRIANPMNVGSNPAVTSKFLVMSNSKFVTKKFPKIALREVIYEDGAGLPDSSSLEKVSEDLIDTTRWSVITTLIFKHIENGKETFYKVDYSVGATESQDERPFEYEGDEVVCLQVEPRKVEVIQYFPVAPK